MTAVSKSLGKSPWEELFHPATNDEIHARRNLLILPQFRTSSPLPEDGSCSGKREIPD